MRVIIIGETVYLGSESIYREIERKEKDLMGKPYYHGRDVDMMDFLDSKIPDLKAVGPVSFHYTM